MSNALIGFLILWGDNAWVILAVCAAAGALYYARNKYFKDPLKKKGASSAPTVSTERVQPTQRQLPPGSGEKIYGLLSPEDKKALVGDIAEELTRRMATRGGDGPSLDSIVNARLAGAIAASEFDGSLDLKVTKNEKGGLSVKVNEDTSDLKIVLKPRNGNGHGEPQTKLVAIPETPALAATDPKKSSTFTPAKK